MTNTTVMYNGTRYTLTREAYVDHDYRHYQRYDVVVYKAHGKDESGNTVEIIWDILPAYRECGYDGESNTCANTDCPGDCDDESNLCDWANASRIYTE